MEYKHVVELENRLIALLKEEYNFYQSLYILIDKQKDLLKYDRDQKILTVYDEIQSMHKRITESEQKVAELRNGNRKLFNLAATSPEVRKLVNSISTLIKKNLSMIKENEEFANDRYTRIKEELESLRNNQNLGQYNAGQEDKMRILDGKG
ncbi:MAG: hypothetical protein KKG33_07995 [candidate division Zixibacteria bacterium]|nr:hypothetical protein [candidate division Zixibacteria bacterium]MBU1471371.1 hypothetical protein [candidate division Zixibacteria bacterium]MBU2625488.1 hypothetical protein [candidate division Zixibacteria bacterium]